MKQLINELKNTIAKLLLQYEEGCITGDDLLMAIGAAVYEYEMKAKKSVNE